MPTARALPAPTARPLATRPDQPGSQVRSARTPPMLKRSIGHPMYKATRPRMGRSWNMAVNAPASTGATSIAACQLNLRSRNGRPRRARPTGIATTRSSRRWLGTSRNRKYAKTSKRRWGTHRKASRLSQGAEGKPSLQNWCMEASVSGSRSCSVLMVAARLPRPHPVPRATNGPRGSWGRSRSHRVTSRTPKSAAVGTAGCDRSNETPPAVPEAIARQVNARFEELRERG